MDSGKPGGSARDLAESALFYHRNPRPGKLEIQPTKPLGNQRDLALAYSPGVAAACEAIAADPAEAATLTVRQNLVAVVTNGTAVLGLGDIGPLASKPVMEGKAVLFKKFAGIDVFDIEVAEKEVDRLVDVVAALEPTFGGINLEDIKAPECFEVEERLKARMGIPVFHDDQHGTAIIVGAAVTNALELAGKRIEDVKIVNDEWVITGSSGVVLIVVGTGQTMKQAQAQAYSRIKNILIPSMYYRTDIGEPVRNHFNILTISTVDDKGRPVFQTTTCTGAGAGVSSTTSRSDAWLSSGIPSTRLFQ